MADKKNIAGSSAQGAWAPNSDRAPLHGDSELIVEREAFVDGFEDPTDAVPSSAKQFDQASLPYPEATYWGRYGSKIFNAVRQQTAIINGAGFAITAADGSVIIL